MEYVQVLTVKKFYCKTVYFMFCDPTAFKGGVGVGFTHGVSLGGWAFDPW